MYQDYRSFPQQARKVFAPLLAAWGYQPLGATAYVRPRPGGWREVFALQKAGHGNPFFYVNGGITLPAAEPGADTVMVLSQRLHRIGGGQGFACASKAELQDSAQAAVQAWAAHMAPWLQSLDSWAAIAAEYLHVNSGLEGDRRPEPKPGIAEQRLGQHTLFYGAAERATLYARLLQYAGQTADARRWLAEAARILQRPVYRCRDGRQTHMPEPGARLQKPDAEDQALLAEVQQRLAALSLDGP